MWNVLFYFRFHYKSRQTIQNTSEVENNIGNNITNNIPQCSMKRSYSNECEEAVKLSRENSLNCIRKNNAVSVKNKATSLRKREVVLSKISFYIVFVFLFCHSIRIVPNTYEMVTTYTKVRFVKFDLYDLIELSCLTWILCKCSKEGSSQYKVIL